MPAHLSQPLVQVATSVEKAEEAGEVGALGSRKTHGKRLERFTEAGLAPELFDRIDAPIGLDIGAASPEEIAVAVLGSIIKALRTAPGAAA